MHPDLYQRFFEIEDRYWWSVGTRRAFRALIAEIGRGSGRALDVGCGTGVMLHELPPGWRMAAGCDRSETALAYCHQRGLRALVKSDAISLPFSDGCFALVMALDVIEHLDDDHACLRELARVCQSGGHVLLHVPAFQLLWSDKDEINQHRRRYDGRALVALVERAGLRVIHRRYLNTTLLPVALVRSLWQRWAGRRSGSTESAAGLDRLYDIPRPMNAGLTALMDAERWLGSRCPPPFGMSMVCLARKPG
jgi:ubiquinone/menaquinone biosynthesis C-methylase UbiE